MRRGLTYLLGWLVATASTVGLTYGGIRMVMDASSTRGPAAAPAVRPEQPAPAPASSGPATEGRTGASPSATSRRPSPSEKPSPSGSAPDSARPRASGWQHTPVPGGATASVRTFEVTGGRVTFLCTAGEVRVLELDPGPGYVASQAQFGEDSAQVSFASAGQVSRVWVIARDGCYAEVTESV